MNKEVYKHLLLTYGRGPVQWVGLMAEIFRVVVMRVYIVFVISQITVSFASGDITNAKKYALYFFFAYLSASLIGAIGDWLSVRAECVQYGKLSTAFYKKLVSKDLVFYRENQTGYLATIYRQYLDAAVLLLRFFRGEALGTFISLIIPPVVLFFVSPVIGTVFAIIVLIQLLYVLWSSEKINKYRHTAHEMYRRVTGEVSDVMTNIIAFKASGVEDQANTRMAQLIKEEADLFHLRRTRAVLFDLPRNLITICGAALAVYVIIARSATVNGASLELIILTLTYLFQMVRSVSLLPELISTHDDLVTKAYPTLKYLGNEHEIISDPINARHLVIKSGSISIEQISFSYFLQKNIEKKVKVFDNLSITIEGGERVGIVGLSGAGKTTLANLLLRFDEIESGSIKIDGIDIRNVRQAELRRKIAYVPQEPLLFHRTIRENIAYYNNEADQKSIIQAAVAAHAHQFIEKLPDSYDTVVGERGIKLSGGQKQRVAIARAVLKKAPIMIFDEATSALDSESEQIIRKALPEIIGEHTAIVIAHRLSTVAGLDRIIVMHEGKIAEVGNHEELLKLKGLYYSLWQKQTTDFGL